MAAGAVQDLKVKKLDMQSLVFHYHRDFCSNICLKLSPYNILAGQRFELDKKRESQERRQVLILSNNVQSIV